MIADDELARLLEYDDVMIKYFNKSSCLSDHGLSVERANKDMFLNNDGRFLLDICKSNNIFILNGRCGQDKGIGALNSHLKTYQLLIIHCRLLKGLNLFLISLFKF